MEEKIAQTEEGRERVDRARVRMAEWHKTQGIGDEIGDSAGETAGASGQGGDQRQDGTTVED